MASEPNRSLNDDVIHAGSVVVTLVARIADGLSDADGEKFRRLSSAQEHLVKAYGEIASAMLYLKGL